jgi:hypothetical protein
MSRSWCKKRFLVNMALFAALIFSGMLLRALPAQAFEPGKTYDKSNYQEIEDMVIPPMKTWLQNGEIVLKTGKIDFRMWMGPLFETESKPNEGKLDLAEDGYLIDKATGKYPEEIWGYPFPTIDPKDPKAAQKIMENHENRRNRSATAAANGEVNWVGQGGHERTLIALGNYFYYFNRFFKEHRVPNPNGFLKQDMTFIAAPFDLRGTVSMGWHYTDSRESTSFAYVPMLRRVRRTSSAARSDPFMGSDACTDDADGYNGKNGEMKWRLLDTKTILGGFTFTKPTFSPRGPDGRSPRVMCGNIIAGGWEVPGYTGAKWAGPNLTWSPREVYVLEMIPKDTYYNYGSHHLYVDKECFFTWFKVVFSRSGEYIKTVNLYWSLQGSGDDYFAPCSDLYVQIDDKSHHATYNKLINYEGRDSSFNLPTDIIGPGTFTISSIQQLSK